MRTILVIEDNEAVRQELTEILEFEGFRVLLGCDGREGAEIARRQRPDLILCDVMMPNLDGFGTLKAVRADPAIADTPFLFLSARKEDGDLQAGIELEADGYLTKPFAITPLLAAINAGLSASHRRR